MNKLPFIIAVILFSLVVLGAGEGVTVTEKIRVVILPGEVGQGWNMDEIDHLMAILEEKALELGRFRVYPRENLKKILEEQKLAMAGITDESAISLSKIAGAQYAILLTLTHLDAQYNADYEGYTATARMSMKLYNVGNGELLASKRFERQTFYPADTYDEAINDVINMLAVDMMITLREFFKLEGRVVNIRGNRVYLAGLDPKLARKGYIFVVENEFGDKGYLRVIGFDRKRGYVVTEHMYGILPEIGATVREYPVYPYRGVIGAGIYQNTLCLGIAAWGTLNEIAIEPFINTGIFFAGSGGDVPFYTTLGIRAPILAIGRLDVGLLGGPVLAGVMSSGGEYSAYTLGIAVGINGEYQFTPKMGIYLEVSMHLFMDTIMNGNITSSPIIMVGFSMSP